jgi:hypothetical protein
MVDRVEPDRVQVRTHSLRVDAAGVLAPTNPAPGDQSALDDTKLLDVVLYVEYRLA